MKINYMRTKQVHDFIIYMKRRNAYGSLFWCVLDVTRFDCRQQVGSGRDFVGYCSEAVSGCNATTAVDPVRCRRGLRSMLPLFLDELRERVAFGSTLHCFRERPCGFRWVSCQMFIGLLIWFVPTTNRILCCQISFDNHVCSDINKKIHICCGIYIFPSTTQPRPNSKISTKSQLNPIVLTLPNKSASRTRMAVVINGGTVGPDGRRSASTHPTTNINFCVCVYGFIAKYDNPV